MLALDNLKEIGAVVDRPKALGDIRGVTYISTSKQLQPLQKSEEIHHSIQSINTPINPSSTPPHHPHPEERIWAGRTPWVPDAPKIKHDKMKQFYMIDMGQKMW